MKKSGRLKFQYLMAGSGQTQGWLNAMSVKSHGASSTLNIGECPNVAAESFLSQILEPRQDVRAKYYLSPKACDGILRRARERGKELPPELKEALERQSSAAWWRRALLERLRRLLEASGTSRNGSENLVLCVGNGQINQSHLQEKAGALNCMHDQQIILAETTVRRLTPTECERLQGLPDDYTAGGSDTARYKALGNGMAQPCADYVIRRIVEATRAERRTS